MLYIYISTHTREGSGWLVTKKSSLPWNSFLKFKVLIIISFDSIEFSLFPADLVHLFITGLSEMNQIIFAHNVWQIRYDFYYYSCLCFFGRIFDYSLSTILTFPPPRHAPPPKQTHHISTKILIYYSTRFSSCYNLSLLNFDLPRWSKIVLFPSFFFQGKTDIPSFFWCVLRISVLWRFICVCMYVGVYRIFYCTIIMDVRVYCIWNINRDSFGRSDMYLRNYFVSLRHRLCIRGGSRAYLLQSLHYPLLYIQNIQHRIQINKSWTPAKFLFEDKLTEGWQRRQFHLCASLVSGRLKFFDFHRFRALFFSLSLLTSSALWLVWVSSAV